MSILIRYAPASLTREQYDRVNEILEDNAPEGDAPMPQLHVMFGQEPNLRVSEIWESEQDWRAFWDGALKPTLDTVGVDQFEPETLSVQAVWGAWVPEA